VVCVLSMTFDEPSLSEATTLVCRNPPSRDSAESVRRSIGPFGPWVHNPSTTSAAGRPCRPAGETGRVSPVSGSYLRSRGRMNMPASPRKAGPVAALDRDTVKKPLISPNLPATHGDWGFGGHHREHQGALHRPDGLDGVSCRELFERGRETPAPAATPWWGVRRTPVVGTAVIPTRYSRCSADVLC
jgi:hypothetical protein